MTALTRKCLERPTSGSHNSAKDACWHILTKWPNWGNFPYKLDTLMFCCSFFQMRASVYYLTLTFHFIGMGLQIIEHQRQRNTLSKFNCMCSRGLLPTELQHGRALVRNFLEENQMDSSWDEFKSFQAKLLSTRNWQS